MLTQCGTVGGIGGAVLVLLATVLFAASGFAQPVSYFSYDASGNLTNIQPTGPTAPVILAQPRSLLLKQGRIGGFSVVAVGTPPLAYQWRFNGKDILWATTDSVVFSPVGTENLGWYTVVVSNAAGQTTSESVFLSFDLDGDGLPDEWERRHFGGLSQSSADDFDNDGVSNLDEYLDGTNPADSHSVYPRLRVRAWQGTVTVNPNLPKYSYGQSVTLTVAPDSGKSFLGWSGDMTGAANPAVVVMDRTKTVSAICGLPLGQSVEVTDSAWQPGGAAGWFGQAGTTHDGVDAGQSGPIGPGEESWMETTRVLSGITKMTFWCKLAGESNDVLRLFINSVEQGAAAIGPTDWRQRSFFLPGGSNALRWVFTQPGPKATNPTFTNSAWVDQVTFKDVCSVPLAEAMDTAGWTWRSDANVGWCGQTFITQDGGDAAQSAPLVADSQSWVETTNVLNVDGILAFWWKVNSAARADALRFVVNGVEQAFIEGSVDWEKRTAYLSRGTNVLRWLYTRGPTVEPGLLTAGDGAWLDQVSVTPYPDPNLDLDGNGVPDLAEFIFRGRAGDGHDENGALDVVVNGVAPPFGPFVGSSGDGHDNSAVMDFRPDGMSLVLDVFVGTTGDGFDSRAVGGFSIDGSALAAFVFFGGKGDGFDASGVAEFQPDGMFLVTDAFRGGTGDGFDEFIVHDFPVDGTAVALEVFLGSVGDGFQESIAYDVPISGFTLAAGVFLGGAGDGFDRSTKTNINIANVLWWTNWPNVVWPALADIYYGTRLSSAQLNATADAPGTFNYSPASGTLLPAGTNQLLTVIFQPLDPVNYYSVRMTNRLNVAALRLTSVTLLQPGHLRLTFACNTNVILMASTNLVNWVPVQTNYAAGQATFEYHEFDLDVLHQRFYRLVIP
jgi:hypothetical protein